MTPHDNIFKVLFGCEQDDIGETVIITPFLPPSKFISGSHEKTVFKGRLYSGVNVDSGGGCYTIIKCPMAASLAGDCVLFLGRTKAKHIIYAGSCGGLRTARIGDIIVCEKAFSGGGFSDYYPPGKGIEKILESNDLFQASSGFVEDLWKMAMNFSPGAEMFKKGSIFTIASLAAETRDVLEKIGNREFDGIDMELAAVYHAAEVLGIKAAGILFVGDRPIERPFWEKPSPEGKEKLKTAIEMVIKLSSLAAVKTGSPVDVNTSEDRGYEK